MAGNDDAFGFVLASARRTLGQVRVDARVAKPAPGRGAALADHVQHMIGIIETRIDAAAASYPAVHLPAAQDAVIRNLWLYTQLARALHESLPWLDRPSGGTLDLGTSYFIDEMALAIVGTGVETVAVPSPTYMYSTLSWPFRLTALQHLKVDVATGTRPIVLFFPLKESDSVLFHAVFAHELGHAAVDEHKLVDAVLTPIQADPTFLASLAQAAAFFQATFGLDATAAERVARARLAGWTEELLCDAVALHYLGPSYLFGFTGFVLASNWTDPQPTHPPPTLRVGLLMEQLTTLGWDVWLQAARPDLWAWFEWVRATLLPPMSPDNEFLRDVANERSDAIRATAQARVGGATYVPATFAPHETDLAALLQRRILPAELAGAPVDRRNILLAGWMYSLVSNPDGTPRVDAPAALSDALTEIGLQRFIAKALELSTVAETWSELP